MLKVRMAKFRVYKSRALAVRDQTHALFQSLFLE